MSENPAPETIIIRSPKSEIRNLHCYLSVHVNIFKLSTSVALIPSAADGS